MVTNLNKWQTVRARHESFG